MLPAFQEMEKEELLKLLEREMLLAARRFEFEKAASLRDRIEELRISEPTPPGKPGTRSRGRGRK